VDALARLSGLIDEPSAGLIASDYDGTLAPIVDNPSAAAPEPGAIEALVGLAELVGHVAIVTGRAAADAVALGGLDRIPGVTVLGLYGEQRWTAGGTVAAPAPPGLARARVATDALLAKADPAVSIEDKGSSFAVHTRRARDPAAELDRLSGPLAAVAEAGGLRLEPGRMVLEVRGDRYDKGTALARLIEDWRPRFAMYIGDDRGDVPAFETLARLRGDGLATCSVASANDEAPDVAGSADIVLPGTGAVVALLDELLAELRAGRRPAG
jgi:trehalose 6-phosphate phosphatase